ncbi:Lish domain-containing [Elysia marginata]|uniref:Lish domain-containing n=1 Tax=Elysia marginata TaxID=1093978 RepID=A0AAV4JLY9_9GAST|nr:Lish domain-containing [Elysia marginata]
MQGKHGNQKSIEESVLQGIKDHISSIPIVESQYCRARTERKYLDPFLSVAAMYKLYSNMCDAKGLVKASQDKYRKVFDYDFNLGFHRPKKDQCEVCIAHKNRHGVATAEENQEYVNHINNKVTAREIKDIAKKGCTPIYDYNGMCIRSATDSSVSSREKFIIFLQETIRCVQPDCV